MIKTYVNFKSRDTSRAQIFSSRYDDFNQTNDKNWEKEVFYRLIFSKRKYIVSVLRSKIWSRTKAKFTFFGQNWLLKTAKIKVLENLMKKIFFLCQSWWPTLLKTLKQPKTSSCAYGLSKVRSPCTRMFKVSSQKVVLFFRLIG